MTANLPAPTAKSINEAHQCARESAENAVEWAIKCGQLLAAKKEELAHGQFQAWVEKNCAFSVRSAQLYMKAADQKRNALPFSSLRQLLAPAEPAPKSNTPKGAVSVVNPEGGRTTAANEGTEETGNDRPAAPVFDAPPPNKPIAATEPANSAGDFDFSDYEPEDDEAYKQNIENVMMADDKLAAMREELKQVRRELQAVKASRDHYQSEAGAAARLVKARDREIEKLRKEIETLRSRAAA